mmetsp:Transcript_119057/g.342095  ORF Transcript_119057/g.342095 Transcript_119057/m.342095 type:complete len:216 (-) Transcript_119057:623-1270(-)
MISGNCSRQLLISSLVNLSLFHNMSAFSATSEFGYDTHIASRRASCTCKRWTSATGMRKIRSSISEMKSSCLEEMEKGQHFNNASTTSDANRGSFSVNFFVHSSSCVWNMPSHSTLCNGISTLCNTSRLSSLSGVVKPLIIRLMISNNSDNPLCTSASIAAWRHKFWIVRRMNERSDEIFEWILLTIVFKISRSLGSSESISSRSFCTNVLSRAI